MFNGQSKFFHSIFWLEVSRDFGEFLRRLRGNLEWNWRVWWVLESGGNSAEFHRCCRPEKKENYCIKIRWKQKLVETQKGPSKKPLEFQPLSRISNKKFLAKSRLPVPENWPFEPSWLGRDCSFHQLWKKSPTHEMIHRFFTPVQSKSNRTPQNPPKTHRKSMLLPKNPRLDPRKITIKTCLFLRNFCRKKNWILLDDSKADKNIPNYSLTQLANWSVVRRLDSSIF
jgi:hypothetical protein